MPMVPDIGNQSYPALFARAAEPLSSFTLSDLGWLIIFNLLLFQSTIQNATGFSYVDETAVGIIVLAFLASIAGSCYRGAVRKSVWHCSICRVPLGEVLAHPMLRHACQGYPWWRLPAQQALFYLVLKSRSGTLARSLTGLRRGW